MRVIVCTQIAALVLVSGPVARRQGKTRTLVAVWAHADDEAPVAPILARYAREGVEVHMIIATDGAGDLNAGRRSFECHKTQISQEAIGRVFPAMRDVWKGEIPLSPMIPAAPTNDLFR